MPGQTGGPRHQARPLVVGVVAEAVEQVAGVGHALRETVLDGESPRMMAWRVGAHLLVKLIQSANSGGVLKSSLTWRLASSRRSAIELVAGCRSSAWTTR